MQIANKVPESSGAVGDNTGVYCRFCLPSNKHHPTSSNFFGWFWYGFVGCSDVGGSFGSHPTASNSSARHVAVRRFGGGAQRQAHRGGAQRQGGAVNTEMLEVM